MARKRSAKATSKVKKETQLDFGEVSEPQARFLASKTFFTCYGGARGGGKTHVMRLKAVGMALNYPGIRLLMIRCHYPELEENLVRPILKWVPEQLYSYNATMHLMRFSNGSEIKFGHYDGDGAENE
jgi:phage terminase large subunit